MSLDPGLWTADMFGKQTYFCMRPVRTRLEKISKHKCEAVKPSVTTIIVFLMSVGSDFKFALVGFSNALKIKISLQSQSQATPN